ncbi:syntaxin-4 isoform X3 [Phaenicophaeus curvirostris]|uniref:syntaxin-4 isoform X3 n=1 Tax=Phaenicophaeus curvirostris TaxID=33595 RepID=UPI0037F0B43F
MRDRTRELNQQGGGGSSEEDEGEEAKVALMGLSPPANDTLHQAQGVRAALATLEQKLQELEEQQERVLGTPLPPEGLKQELQTLREEIQALTQHIRTRLRALEPGREEEEDEDWGSVGARVRRTQHGVLAQQFLALTGRCHAAQARYRQRSLDRIRRQLHIAGSPSVTEEELEQMVESGQSEVFVSNVLGATRATRAALEEVGVRHRELQRLEKGLRELGELFSLLSTNLEGQGEVIDRIERNVAASGARLDKGRRQLRAAAGGRGRARKKLVAIACVAVTVLVIGAAIAGTIATT